MKKKYDAIVIGLGPAGMAVSIMASEMGLNVCAIEKNKIGGECMNVGCIPSKSILRMAKQRNTALKYLKGKPIPDSDNSLFRKIDDFIKYINDKKTIGMFDKVDLILEKGEASFVDRHTVKVGDDLIRGNKIFICTGTRPSVPPITGIENIDVLTNENIFNLEHIPESMTIIGGGAIGCEMAQAFNRLGCKTTIVHLDPNLLYGPQKTPRTVLEDVFREEGIDVYNNAEIEKVEKTDNKVCMTLNGNKKIVSERLLVAAGRRYDFSSLNLENAGIRFDNKSGIHVKSSLRTSVRNIYAPGDCNGHYLFSHSAMHQGMIALINSMLPFFMKKDFRKYTVPWTIFTEPQVSAVGMSEFELKQKKISYETITMKYEDYGAAIAEEIGIGHVQVYVSTFGRIYGAQIIGEGSGEMINEFALAIQNSIRMHKIMFTQHSFPTMSFLIKRASEQWMMNRMKSDLIKKMAKMFYRMFS